MRTLWAIAVLALFALVTQSAHAAVIVTGDPSCRPFVWGTSCFISNLQPDGPFAFDSERLEIKLPDRQYIAIFEGSFFQANLIEFSIFNSSPTSTAALNIFLSFTDEDQNAVGPTDGRGLPVSPLSSRSFFQIIATSAPVPDFRFHGVTIDFSCSNCSPSQLELSFLSNENIVQVSSSSPNNRVGRVPEPASILLYSVGLGILALVRRKTMLSVSFPRP